MQIREGGGKKPGPPVKGKAPGSGFPLIESRTLLEILEDPEYRDLLEGLKTQLIRLLKDGLELGFLERSMIE